MRRNRRSRRRDRRCCAARAIRRSSRRSTPASTGRAGAVCPSIPSRFSNAVESTRNVFDRAAQPPRWPMYVRQLKQFIRGVDSAFDERKWGFATMMEFLRVCQREGLFRLERDRRGQIRVFPGTALQTASMSAGMPRSDYRGAAAGRELRSRAGRLVGPRGDQRRRQRRACGTGSPRRRRASRIRGRRIGDGGAQRQRHGAPGTGARQSGDAAHERRPQPESRRRANPLVRALRRVAARRRCGRSAQAFDRESSSSHRA